MGNPTDGGKSLEIRNFLGEKVIRRVPMKEGVKVDKTGNKDEIALEGNSIENVDPGGTSTVYGCTGYTGRYTVGLLLYLGVYYSLWVGVQLPRYQYVSYGRVYLLVSV